MCEGADRSSSGQYHALFPKIRRQEAKFIEYLRMPVKTFDYIFKKIAGSLSKRRCNLHARPILQEERLVITLRFLATGQSYGSLAFTFGIGLSTVSTIIQECMDTIWNTLQPLHMPCPTEEDFSKIAESFYEKRRFPNCLGAIDGRHIRIQKPAGSGTAYYNYKKFYSMVLQAHVDADYRYVTIDICRNGSQNDASIFGYSKLKQANDKKLLKIPEARQLPSSNLIAPYYFIGDGAYPLLPILMKPFRGLILTEEKKKFNQRLSSARVVAENAFARTCQKWRIFYTTINQKPDTVEKIVKATCILHNVILDLEIQDRIIAKPVQEDARNLCNDGDEVTAANELERGEEVRRILVQYFSEH